MQKVIAARDVDIYIGFDDIGVSQRIQTASSYSANISGSTEDIGAISTDEPIATENGGSTYDITVSLQKAEAITIMDALATATASRPNGSIAHIRQIVESATITIVTKKLRDVPATATTVTYTNCTGVSVADNVERRSVETLETWVFKARGMTRVSVPY